MKPFVLSSILAPTDLSDASIPALRCARMFADRFSAVLTVLYTEPLVYPMGTVGPADGFYIDLLPERSAQLRREVEQHAGPVMGGRPYEIAVTVGQPIQAILSAAKERHADFIVMGTHLSQSWRRFLLGSVTNGVLHGSECPVLTIADRNGIGGITPYAITNIICPVNFTDVARESLRVAAGLAEAFGARLTIVHVLDPDDVMNVTVDEEKVRRWVSPELQDICSFRELIVRGGPAERVLDCADDIGADLLVIGAQHKMFRDATVIGTTTERILGFASCPVVVVPRPAGRRESSVRVAEQHAVGAER